MPSPPVHHNDMCSMPSSVEIASSFVRRRVRSMADLDALATEEAAAAAAVSKRQRVNDEKEAEKLANEMRLLEQMKTVLGGVSS